MRKKAIPITDERVKLMSEIITAIKLVKMYAWEKSFAKKINGKYNSPQLYYSITHLSHLVHCGPGLVLVQVWRWSCRVPSSTSSNQLLSVSLYHLITSYLAFLAFSFPEPSSQPPFLYISLFLSFGHGHTTEVDTFPCSQLLCSHSLHDFPSLCYKCGAASLSKLYQSYLLVSVPMDRSHCYTSVLEGLLSSTVRH